MQNRFNLFRTILFGIISLASIYSNPCKAQPTPGLPSNQLVLPTKNYEIKFQWHGDSINSKWEPYAALLIPIKLPNCPKQFYMQFDLGSPYSLFYKNKLKEIQLKYPKTIRVTDSVTKLNDYNFKAGEMRVVAKEISIRQFDSSKINWTDKNSIEIIGTIGADFIDNRVAIIDYPRRKLFIGTDIPSKVNSRLELSDFIFARRSVLLPAIIKGKKTMLYFDTGSSAYELLTDKETCQSLSVSNYTPLQYQVKSWDKLLTANTISTNDSIEIAFHIIPIRHATYMEGVSESQVEQRIKIGIGGMIGNKLFLKSILVLNTKNKKFGLINSGT